MTAQRIEKKKSEIDESLKDNSVDTFAMQFSENHESEENLSYREIYENRANIFSAFSHNKWAQEVYSYGKRWHGYTVDNNPSFESTAIQFIFEYIRDNNSGLPMPILVDKMTERFPGYESTVVRLENELSRFLSSHIIDIVDKFSTISGSIRYIVPRIAIATWRNKVNKSWMANLFEHQPMMTFINFKIISGLTTEHAKKAIDDFNSPDQKNKIDIYNDLGVMIYSGGKITGNFPTPNLIYPTKKAIGINDRSFDHHLSHIIEDYCEEFITSLENGETVNSRRCNFEESVDKRIYENTFEQMKIHILIALSRFNQPIEENELFILSCGWKYINDEILSKKVYGQIFVNALNKLVKEKVIKRVVRSTVLDKGVFNSFEQYVPQMYNDFDCILTSAVLTFVEKEITKSPNPKKNSIVVTRNALAEHLKISKSRVTELMKSPWSLIEVKEVSNGTYMISLVEK
jgi:hypothetical protein